MNSKFVMAAFVAFSLFSGNANAITIANEDETAYEITIVFGQGSGGEDIVIEMAAGEVTDELCEEGCTLSLSNGAALTAGGSEEIVIRNGDFEILE